MNLNGTLYEDLKHEKSKIAKKVWNDLNSERYWCVITYKQTDIWNFEHNSIESVPDYACKYLIRYIYKHYGLSYYFFGRPKNYKHLLKILNDYEKGVKDNG